MGPGEVEHAVSQIGIAILLAQRLDSASRDSATPVTMSIRTTSLGSSSTVWRMLTIGSSTGPSLLESGALPSKAAGEASVRCRPMNRMRSVSYDGSPMVVPRDSHHMRHPRRSLLGRSRAARAENRLPAAHHFRLHEQIAERRMRFVLGLRGQHDFRVAGELDRARRFRTIRERHAAQFNIVLGRNADLRVRLDVIVACGETRPELARKSLHSAWRALVSAARRWTTTSDCPDRANSKSCRGNRASHLHANASRPSRASGCSRRRRW